jgi:hypothetical protein
MTEKPKDPKKTLGDVIREAMVNAEREKIAGQAAGQASQGPEPTVACGCNKCVAERGMKLSPVTITGDGAEVSAVLEKYTDGRYVLEVGGDGIEFVENDEGGMGILFRTEQSLVEFLAFIDGVRS